MNRELLVDEITADDSIHKGTSNVACELNGEVIILNMPDGQYYGLKEVGARIWTLLDEPRTIAQICDVLLDEFDVDPDVCAFEVNQVVRELAAIGLVTVKPKTRVA